jgi:MOSC domain-containing protein YiiM
MSGKLLGIAGRPMRAALEPGWRGGASCRVLEPGAIRIGDRVAFEA